MRTGARRCRLRVSQEGLVEALKHKIAVIGCALFVVSGTVVVSSLLYAGLFCSSLRCAGKTVLLRAQCLLRYANAPLFPEILLIARGVISGGVDGIGDVLFTHSQAPQPRTTDINRRCTAATTTNATFDHRSNPGYDAPASPALPHLVNHIHAYCAVLSSQSYLMGVSLSALM